jgi:hypothetical protein
MFDFLQAEGSCQGIPEVDAFVQRHRVVETGLVRRNVARFCPPASDRWIPNFR